MRKLRELGENNNAAYVSILQLQKHKQAEATKGEEGRGGAGRGVASVKGTGSGKFRCPSLPPPLKILNMQITYEELRVICFLFT